MHMWFYFVTTQMENYTPGLRLILWGEILRSSELSGTTTQLGRSSMIPGGSMVGGGGQSPGMLHNMGNCTCQWRAFLVT